MVDEEEISLDKSMVDEGIIDSFGLVEIAGFIEAEFDVKIEESEMNRNNFGSVIKITAFIKNKVNG